MSKNFVDCAFRSIVGDDPVDQATETIYIPRNIYPWICGPANENLDHLQNQYDVMINIPLADSDKIVINGERINVYKVVEILKQIYGSKENAPAILYYIPQVQHNYIRSFLDEIFRQTDVVIETPPENENSDVIILYGDDSKLAAAYSLLSQKLLLQDQVNKDSEKLETQSEKLSNDHRSEVTDQKLNHDVTENYPDESTFNFKMSTNAVASDQPPLQESNAENIQTKHDGLQLLIKQAKKCHDLQKEFNNTIKPYSKKSELVTLEETNNRVNEIIKNFETFVQNGTFQLQKEEETKNDSDSTKFGIPSFMFLIDGRFGIEIYESGTSKMLNEWIPLYLSMAEKSIEIGETAKSHFRDFPNYVIYDILKIIGKPINEIKIDPKWGFEIIEKNGILFFQLETQNGKRMISEEMILAAFFKTMKSRTEKYLNKNIKEIYLSTNFKVSESQRNIFKKAALKVNLEIKLFLRY